MVVGFDRLNKEADLVARIRRKKEKRCLGKITKSKHEREYGRAGNLFNLDS